mmetsp:Transcript_11206/g.9580  ORF Transcript_11206/g.9580 Transcript_11206/m.9580 type:complete len:227 (+) Transcript_11206:60-740(+)
MEQSIIAQSYEHATAVMDFIDKSPSPWHAVAEGKKFLLDAGFKEIFETDSWNLEAGGKYFFSRNNSTLVGFSVGKKFTANDTGFKIIGAHTDSPCLRLAPISKSQKFNYNQACIQSYGGSLWYTWFDRSLTLAGRVIFKSEDGKSLQEELVNLKKPVCCIPNLCIHLRDTAERESLKTNIETDFRPIFSSEVYAALTGKPSVDNKDQKHYGKLLDKIAQELQIRTE